VTVASLALAAAVATMPSTAMAQDEKDAAFKAGIEARKNKQWRDVVTAMLGAIQQDSHEAPPRRVGRVIGFGGTDYLPFFFLGEAYYELKDCANAVVEWEKSVKQGVVQTRPEYKAKLQRGNAECEAKGVLLTEKFEAAVSHASTQLTGANAMMTKLKDKGNANIAAWKSQPNFDAQYQRAWVEYEAARKQLNEAQRTRLQKDFADVGKSTDTVRDIIGTLDTQLTAAMERVSGALQAAEDVKRSIKDAQDMDAAIDTNARLLEPPMIALREDGRKALASAREQLAPSRLSESSVAAARSSVADATSSLKKVLESLKAIVDKDTRKRLDQALALASAAFSRANTELQTLDALMEGHPDKATQERRGRVDAARKQLEQVKKRHETAARGQQVNIVEAAARQADGIHATLLEVEKEMGIVPTLEERGVPRWLQEGAAQFFEGNYAGALDKLDDGTATGAALLHVHLFRAAAEYALFMRSTQKDAARRDRAIADVRRCKELQATFAPDTRAFSPAFIDFYQRDGVPPQSAARTP